MTAAGVSAGKDIVVVTSRARDHPGASRSRISSPSANSNCPNTNSRNSSFPPMLQMLDYIQREKFTEVII